MTCKKVESLKDVGMVLYLTSSLVHMANVSCTVVHSYCRGRVDEAVKDGSRYVKE